MFLVGVKGFEPPTSCSQSKRATNCATPRQVVCENGAGDRGRTGTVSLPLDFESSTSANSITPANITDTLYYKVLKKSILILRKLDLYD